MSETVYQRHCRLLNIFTLWRISLELLWSLAITSLSYVDFAEKNKILEIFVTKYNEIWAAKVKTDDCLDICAPNAMCFKYSEPLQFRQVDVGKAIS